MNDALCVYVLCRFEMCGLLYGCVAATQSETLARNRDFSCLLDLSLWPQSVTDEQENHFK